MTEKVSSLLSSENVLTFDEEKIVFKEYAETKNIELRNAIAMKNIGLVKKFSSKYTNMGIDIEELQQEGVFGLITAIEKFDSSKDIKFSTYAYHWINQAMSRYLYNYKSLIRIPVNLVEKVYRMQKIEKDYFSSYGCEPSCDYLAGKMNVSLEKIAYLKQLSMFINSSSLNSKINKDNADEDSEVMDFLKDTENEIERAILKRDETECINKVMNDYLSKKELHVLSLRFGLNGSKTHTLDEIGKIYGVSRERIRQIERYSLQKLSRSPKIKALR